MKMEWKIIGEFYIQCRNQNNKEMIMSIQLYKVDNDYLIYIQRPDKGNIFIFLDYVMKFKNIFIL